MRAALLGALALAALDGQAQAEPVARLRAYVLECSQATLAEVPAIVAGADALLRQGCQLGLSLSAALELKGGCGLPSDQAGRRKALQELLAPLKAGHPEDLALLVVPTGFEARYSWAVIDISRFAGCSSPKDPRWLHRFGALFLTDFGLATAVQLDASRPGGASQPFASLLLAHEVMHALTHRPHPTRLPTGNLMADTLGAMGPALTPDWCACAKRSPYLRP